jgi:proteasome accessory factor C
MVNKLADNQVARLLDLVPYLTLNQGVSLEKIASDFSISKSDVLNDLNTLWMCGLPGYTPLELIDLSFETGFVSIRNAEILSNPRKLTNNEVGAIIVGLSILREVINPNSTHEKLIEDLSSRLAMKSKLMAPTVVKAEVSASLREMIFSAMKKNESLRISYHSYSRDEISLREIIPLSFSYEANHEYVHSFCQLSQDFRVFRLDRIMDVDVNEKLSETNVPQEKPNEHAIDLLIKVFINARKIAETFNVKELKNLNTGDELQVKAFNSEWIVRTISSLRGDAAITQPLDIRNLIANRAQNALNLYL